MKLIDPVRGSVVETTDPRTINDLRYGKGYHVLEDKPTPPQEEKTGIVHSGHDLQA